MSIYAEVWCRMGDEPADAPDGLCTPHRAGVLSGVMLERARLGLCFDCGHDVDGHDLRAADGCAGCDECIAANR